MAATATVLSLGTSALPVRRVTSARRATPAPRPVLAPRTFGASPVQADRSNKFLTRATTTEEEAQVDVEQFFDDLKEKWDNVENKTSVVVYGAGAVVLLWLSSTIVGAVNSVPLLPKLLELVGLGYTAWFVYRYLLFKSSREELIEDVEELKKKITGATDLPLPSTKGSSSSSSQSAGFFDPQNK